MDAREARTLDGQTTTVAPRAIEDLADRLAGPVILPENPNYDSAREVWNGMIGKEPALIARCMGTADVIAAVRFARDRDLRVAIRGGGHNVAGTAVCDGGLVIDLSATDGVRVGPHDQTAWVQAGATWADLDRETQVFGLATPGGVVSDTGIAGLTLGGGIGHLRCKHGLSCDALQAAEVVTAEGEVLRASAAENTDLFWALRGGGGNFGVITAFEYEIYPVGPEVAMCLVFYPGDRLPEVLPAYRAFCAEAPNAISTLVFAGELPDEELFPEEWVHKQKFAIMGCYAGPAEEGEVELEPLRHLAEPVADFSDTMAYVDFQQLLDEDYPTGMRYYWKSLYLDELSGAAIDRMGQWAETAPSPLSTVDIWQLGGAIAEAGPEEGAFAPRDAPFLLGVEANWEDPATDEANIAWVRDCFEDMQQFSQGREYLNFPGFLEESDATMKTSLGPNYDRLTEIKARYDPDNFFRLNQNIRPA